MSNGIRRKYNLNWPEELHDLDIELAMLRENLHDNNPLPHYKAIDRLLWPEDDVHRWSDLAFEALSQNSITVLMGPSDSGKTYPSAKWGLIEYWTDPDNTLVLVSSTDVRGLELRVWGAIKDLYNRAREKFPGLQGVPLEAKHAITTDVVGDAVSRQARVLRKGIICIPCLQSGRYVGLGKYVGVKQKRLRQIADECQLMGSTFLDAVPNFLGKDYKGVFLGNPLDPLDPLGRVAEPVKGWQSIEEPQKTTTWKTKFYNGTCVNFVGTDSPNFDFSEDEPPRYPYMISWLKIKQVEEFWGRDSVQYYSQCKGVMKLGLVGRRVITVELCEQHGAAKEAIWLNTDTTRIYALDPAYGGEDRCVGGFIEFGRCEDETQIIRVNPPVIYAVKPGIGLKPERQIADQLAIELGMYKIEPNMVFYDSFGKGTIGQAFAEVFGSNAPQAVDSGAPPTTRPVRNDLYINDEKTRSRRLKTCKEHYSKFVTEMWFSVRYVIECGQMRELPDEVRTEGCLREYGIVSGNRFELEKKEDTRIRMGRSPDLMDWLAVAVEGARRMGFQIGNMDTIIVEGSLDDELLEAEATFDNFIQGSLLQHA